MHDHARGLRAPRRPRRPSRGDRFLRLLCRCPGGLGRAGDGGVQRWETRRGDCVDRNGLRPARYVLTRSGLLAVASEAGAVPVADDDVLEKGRLGPGKMIAVDLEAGGCCATRRSSRRWPPLRPYGEWLRAERRALEALPFAKVAKGGGVGRAGRAGGADEAGGAGRSRTARRPAAPPDRRRLHRRRRRDDHPAHGAARPRATLLDGQRHAAGDPLRATRTRCTTTSPNASRRSPTRRSTRCASVSSCRSLPGWGGAATCWSAAPEHAHQLELPSPVLNEAETGGAGRPAATGRPRSRPPTTSRAGRGVCARPSSGLSARPPTPCATAPKSSCSATASPPYAPEASYVPPLLAVGAVHHDLIREACAATPRWSSRRRSAGACTTSPASSATAPRRCARTSRSRPFATCGSAAGWRRVAGRGRRSTTGRAIPVTPRRSAAALPRLGGARPAQDPLQDGHLAAVELPRCAALRGGRHRRRPASSWAFAGTPSRIGGLSVEELAQETVWIHQQAFPELTSEKLQNYGFIRYRPRRRVSPQQPGGRQDAAACLRRGAHELYRSYRDRLAERPPTVLRDLLRARARPRAGAPRRGRAGGAILRRFSTGGMSLGALSREAHETMAIALNRIGGRSNSGEGGEDAARDRRLDDVDGDGLSARFPHLQGRAQRRPGRVAIQQVASGRFGVTPAYLAGAEQLEIKIAQGAKPGEGGELPGDKVTRVHRDAAPRAARPHADLAAAAPRHLLDRGSRAAHLRPAAGQSAGRHLGQAGRRLGHRHHRRRRGQGRRRRDPRLGPRRRHGGRLAQLDQARRHPWELGPGRDARGAADRRLPRARPPARRRRPAHGHDVVVAAVLGADEFAFGTAVLLAEGCVMARVCHLNKCPVGIATQDDGAARAVQRPARARRQLLHLHRRGGARAAGRPRPALAGGAGRSRRAARARARRAALKTDGLDRGMVRGAGGRRSRRRVRRGAGAPAAAPARAAELAAERPSTTLDDLLLADPEVATGDRRARPRHAAGDGA